MPRLFVFSDRIRDAFTYLQGGLFFCNKSFELPVEPAPGQS